jgi:small subunit ribosomal protein S1
MNAHNEQNEPMENGAGEESFKQLFEQSLREQPMIRRGETVKGTVVHCGQEVVVIDIGAKAEGTIPLSEFATIGVPVPAVGDQVEAQVRSVGGASGVELSVLDAHRRSVWSEIEAAMESGVAVDGRVVAEVKGGFKVDLGGIEAFMPRSEADTSPRVQAEELVGQPCQVRVIEARRRPENIVVSRKQILQVEQEKQQAAFFAGAKIGDKVTGKVKRLTDFGAFVDIGGVDALLHISDITWRRVRHPKEVLSVGQGITAEITKLTPDSGKVSISMRALQPDPWQQVGTTYEPGMRLTGTVRQLLDFGAVVELEPGVEGLIHRSEMSWTRRDVKPTEVLAEGDVVDVSVLEVDPETRRIRLSLKEVSENPWQSWLGKHPVGSRVSGKIKTITDFGFFVGLGDDLDGLVHVGNIAWDKDGAEALQGYSKGQQVECVVLGVDVERQRISLGLKQLTADPMELFLEGAKRGSVVTGKVVAVHNGYATIELAEGVHARLGMREVPRDSDEVKLGNEIQAKVVDIHPRRRQIELSIRQLLRDEERDAVRNYAASVEEEKAPSALALELQRKLLGGKKQDK